MKNLEFPLFKTKSPAGSPRFDLIDPQQTDAYFQFKAGSEIKKIQNYLRNNTFLILLLGKKNAGKGTYSKFFAKIVGSEKIAHVSVGDLIRDLDKEVADPQSRKELESFLKKNYRGWLPLEKLIEAQLKRSTMTIGR
mgnify:CR=1 FL=1